MPIGVQGDLWQMGVGIPIPNRSFRAGKYRVTSLASGAAVGATSLTLTALTEPTHILHWMQVGDSIQLGPSSAAVNLGQTETVTVTALPGTDWLPTVNALTFAYNSGDQVTAIGTCLAAGWTLLNPRESFAGGEGGTRAEGILRAPTAGYPVSGGGGDDDYFGQQWYHYVGSGGTAVANGYLVSTRIGDNIFPRWGATVRAGCYYRVDPTWDGAVTGDVNLAMFVGDQNSQTYDDFTIFSGGSVVSDWTRAEGTMDFTGVDKYCDYVRVGVRCIPTGGSIRVWTDHVWAEHAFGVNSSDLGYYTFTDAPVQGSFRYNKRRNQGKNFSIDNRLMRYSSTDSLGIFPKWDIDADFSGINQTMYNALMDLLNWQNRGYFLTLHTFIDDLPWVIYGKMNISGIRKSSGRISHHAFTFSFREA